MFYEDEMDAALAQDAMNQGEYAAAAVRQYAAVYGEADTASAWVLTPYDTWERNPFYVGEPQPHPEDDSDLYEDDPFTADAFDDVELPF